MIQNKFDLHIDIVTGAELLKKNVLKRQGNVHTRIEIEGLKAVNQFDVQRAIEGGVKNVVSALFPAFNGKTIDIIDKGQQIETYKNQIAFYKDFSEKLKNSTKNINTYLHIEGVYFIDKDNSFQMLERFGHDGIKSVGIMWNDDNSLGCGNHTKNDHGLTDLGKDFIKNCIRNGIIIDLAHTSYMTFFDIIELLPTSYKAMFSHGNVFDLHHHNRNLKRDQIETLIEKDIVFGLSFVGEFIGSTKLEDWIRHVDYVLNIPQGDKIIAIGSDYDGMFEEDLVLGLEDISKMKSLEEIIEAKYGHGISKKIFYENASRIFH